MAEGKIRIYGGASAPAWWVDPQDERFDGYDERLPKPEEKKSLPEPRCCK